MTCTKDDKKEPAKTDFRDKYIGKYTSRLTINCYGALPPCSSTTDTIISVKYGMTDSTLNVLGREVYLDASGTYSAYHYGLSMVNDSIYSTFMNGGLGGGQYESIIGKRTSTSP